jgi:hypothetical protein
MPGFEHLSQYFPGFKVFLAFWMPSIAAWLSVFIVILLLKGAANIAVKMAESSALVDDGHSRTAQLKVHRCPESLTIHPHPMCCFVPSDVVIFCSDPSV